MRLQQQLTTKLTMELRVQQGSRRRRRPGRRGHLGGHVQAETLQVLIGHAGFSERSLSFRALGEQHLGLDVPQCAPLCGIDAAISVLLERWLLYRSHCA